MSGRLTPQLSGGVPRYPARSERIMKSRACCAHATTDHRPLQLLVRWLAQRSHMHQKTHGWPALGTRHAGGYPERNQLTQKPDGNSEKTEHTKFAMAPIAFQICCPLWLRRRRDPDIEVTAVWCYAQRW